MEQVIFNPIFWVILFLASICSLLASMLGRAQAREKYFEEYYEKWYNLNKYACEAWYILRHNYYKDQKYRSVDEAFFELDKYYGEDDEDEQEQKFNSERDKGE